MIKIRLDPTLAAVQLTYYCFEVHGFSGILNVLIVQNDQCYLLNITQTYPKTGKRVLAFIIPLNKGSTSLKVTEWTCDVSHAT